MPCNGITNCRSPPWWLFDFEMSPHLQSTAFLTKPPVLQIRSQHHMSKSSHQLEYIDILQGSCFDCSPRPNLSVFTWKEAPHDNTKWITATDMYMDANPTCRQLDVHGRKGLAPRLAKSHKNLAPLWNTSCKEAWNGDMLEMAPGRHCIVPLLAHSSLKNLASHPNYL